MILKRKSMLGFTLIELMIAVAIVGILSVIAYPSYERYVVRTNRAEAQQFMVEVASLQEQYLADARAYGTLAQLNAVTPSRVDAVYSVSVVPNNAATPPSFVVRAVPKSGSRQASDGTLELNSEGEKTPAEKWR